MSTRRRARELALRALYAAELSNNPIADIIQSMLKNLNDKKVVVHELIHALWHIADYIGYKLTYETQEWQAILFEYLYSEVLDKNGYTEYDMKKK